MSMSCRKLQIVIVNDDPSKIKDQYKFIRDSQYAQYLGLNRCMSYLMTGYYKYGMDLKNPDFKEYQKTVKNSLSIFDDINFGTGIDSKSAITQKVKKDFSTALKNGLAKGERSINNYKRSYPLMTRGRDIKIYEENNEYFIKWVNKITFKIIMPHKRHKTYNEVKTCLDRCISKEYGIAQSSFQFNSKNKLILILSMDIPENEAKKEFVPGRTVGVDLGMKIPAYCSLNDVPYIRQSIGDINDLLRVKQQFKVRKERLQKKLSLLHPNKNIYKTEAWQALSEKESNYAKTYNHMISRRIIDFAKKNQAEQINLELLSMEQCSENSSILRFWGYYQLQQMIEYKAKREGILVAYVDPYHTSQTCSCCGHYEEGQRVTQEHFICKNPECKNFDKAVNADYNASRNIAMSSAYIQDAKDSQYYKNKEKEE